MMIFIRYCFILSFSLALAGNINPFESELTDKEIGSSLRKMSTRHSHLSVFFAELDRCENFKILLINPFDEYEISSVEHNWIAESNIDEMKKVLLLKSALIEFFQKEGEAAFCYFPIHEIRGYRDNVERLRLTVCWDCNQAIGAVGDKKFGWQIGEVENLRRLLLDILPIPERFNNISKIKNELPRQP